MKNLSDTPLGETIFWLRYAPRRVRCREHGVRVERVPWAAHDSSFTHAFEELVAWCRRLNALRRGAAA